MPERLGPECFDLPAAELRRGYRSAVYFWRSKLVLEAEKPGMPATMQVFQKGHSVLCGVDQAIAVLKVAAGHWEDLAKAEKLFDGYMQAKLASRAAGAYGGEHQEYSNLLLEVADYEDQLNDLWVPGWDKLEVSALRDGDEIEPWEPVLQIKGPLAEFVHLESVYLGVLARGTRVATNVRRVCEVTNGKPLLFFADRFDDFHNQGSDGYAAKVGGASGFATDAMGAWWGERGLGTMPHALIAAYKGDVVEATRAFQKHIPDVNLIPLVDFTNDCVRESVRCADVFRGRLWGVRLDTSETMIDPSVVRSGRMGDSKPTGVNPILVAEVRKALDGVDAEHVKIVVSGGFDTDKIRMFEAQNVPVDSYAVGSSLLKGSIDFTADVLEPVGKTGRWLRDADRLESVE